MYSTILIPVDFEHNEQSLQSLKKAEKLLGDNEIILLHVIEEVPEYILAQIPDDIRLPKISKVTEELKELVKESGVKARVEVRKGGSYNSILESAHDNNADLIIINSHKPGFQDYLLGSTAAKVVRHAKCAVLVER